MFQMYNRGLDGLQQVRRVDYNFNFNFNMRMDWKDVGVVYGQRRHGFHRVPLMGSKLLFFFLQLD